MHDAANSISTIVSTRVLSPRQAVIWAAFFNFIAFLFFGLHVANTIGKGIVDIAIVDQRVPRPYRWDDRRRPRQGGTRFAGLVRHFQDRDLSLRLPLAGARSGSAI